MTDDWNGTPWAGEPVKAMDVSRALTVTKPAPLEVKAVTGPGVQAYANDYPLSSLMQEPQVRAAAYLKAYKMGWFYKAESKISGDLATLPWTVHDGDINSDDPRESEVKRPDLDIPFEQLNPIEQFMRLMEKPNPKQTGRQLRQKTFIRKDMAGVGFWYLEAASERAPITAIYGISPTRLWPAYKAGQLLGYVLDKNAPSGATMTFEPWEIVAFSNASVSDDQDADIFGVGVVEAVYAELPLTDLMTRHTADLLSTGGRLAGMLWPKERALNEDEFSDAQRAWRNVVSDPSSAKRLLLFPEPMEWASGASTPAEIGIPELAQLNRDNILTAFPIAPEMLGVPMPSGINASGETRRALYDFYWSDTIEPRSMSFDEIIQTNVLSRYEAAMGKTFRYESELPKLDDASSLLEKAGAFRSLVAIGFDPKDTIKAVGLDHIKWTSLPPMLDPNNQAALAANLPKPGEQVPATSASVSDDTAGQSSVTQVVSKATKSRAAIVEANDQNLRKFLSQQRDRVIDNLRATMPRTKSLRGEWAVKADPDWWDAPREDALLRETLAILYVQAARGSLQVVADAVDGIIPNRAVGRIVDDLLTQGGQRIKGINETTREAVQADLSEGTRRGYSLDQMIEGVPDEQYRGIKSLPVFDDARAEVITRTETMLSYNRAALDAYGEFGVEHLLAYDGDEDAECAERNGQQFTVEEALSIEDHPNGTLDWAPVVDKAAHFDAEAFKSAVLEAVRERPTTINNYIEPARSDVHMDAPVVHVNTPDVNVAPPNVTVNVPEQPAPIVNVKVPERHVTIEAPPPAEVTVNLPAQKTPHITVEAPPPAKVTVEAPVTVNIPEQRRMTKTVHRDKTGQVTKVTEEPDGD